MWDQNYAYSELPNDEETDEEVDFIIHALGLEDGSILLDLCCGQGRHSSRLADMGFSVIGLDSSRTLLEMAERNAELFLCDAIAKARTLWFVEGDMRNIPLRNGIFDAVINLFTSFGFFDDTDNLQTLRSIASILKPGGKFLLDYWNPHVAVQMDGTRNWWWITDSLLNLAEVRYNYSTGRLQDHRTIIDIRNGSMESTVRDIRFYTLPELDRMMEESGLRIIEAFGDIDGREYNSGTRRLITVSEK